MTSAQLTYKKALDFATKKHEGQFRIGGLPYISHPIAVAEIIREKGYGLEYQLTALFHDLLEDTDATEAEIEAIAGTEVLTAVKLLTKTEGYSMDEYVQNICTNPIAKAVKTADRLHNLRCALCTDEDFKRRYVLETVDWYLNFDKEIPIAAKQLADSMEKTIAELSLLYDAVKNIEFSNQ